MRTIEVEDDLYEFLLRNTSRFGESASDVIKRLVGIMDSSGAEVAEAASTPGKSMMNATAGNGHGETAAEYLNSSAFLVHGNVVGRFLSALSWLYSRNPEKFEKVLLLTGRKRRYFAKSPEELEESGNSVMPKRIPNSPYWVFTNSPTQLKKEVLTDVMRVLGYDSSTTRPIVDALV